MLVDEPVGYRSAHLELEEGGRQDALGSLETRERLHNRHTAL